MRIVVEGKELWDILDWKYIFNWLFFHGHVSFRGCKLEDHEKSTSLKPNIVGWGLNMITPSSKRNTLDLEKQIRQNDSKRLMQWRVSTHNFPTSSVMSFLFAITSWWFKGLSIPSEIGGGRFGKLKNQSQNPGFTTNFQILMHLSSLETHPKLSFCHVTGFKSRCTTLNSWAWAKASGKSWGSCPTQKFPVLMLWN